MKDLAATYSRASYTGTTIGKTAFDGRVRDGIGSDHSFITTKNLQARGLDGGVQGNDTGIAAAKMLKNGIP